MEKYVINYSLNGNLSNINAVMPVKGTPGFNASDPRTANLILYNYGGDNWAAIGCDAGGTPHIRKQGYDYTFTDGHIYCNGNLLV